MQSVRSFRLLWLVGLSLLVLFCITACQPSVNPTGEPETVDGTTVAELTEENTPTATQEPSPEATATPPQILGRFATDPAQIGFLRVVHAAPDTPPVDVYVNSSPLVSGLEYGLATGRTNVINGQYTVYIVERGSEPPASGAAPASPLASAGIDLPVGASILLVLTGTADQLTLTLFEESNEPLDAELSRVSVIHAVPAAAEVTVQQNGETIINPVGLGQRSENVELPNAETVLDFVIDGETVFSYPFNPLPRTDYMLVFHGRMSAEEDVPDQYGVLAYDHLVSGRAEVRAINASTAATSLDIYLNGQLFSPNVGANSAGERQTIPDGQYNIAVYPAGADVQGEAAPLVETQFTLLPDTAQALIITGGDEFLQVLPFAEDLSPLAPDTARIAYINALESAPAAQVGNGSAVRSDIGTIGFGQGSAYIPINVGTGRVFWSSDEGFLEDIEFQAEAGSSYLYFLTGNETPFILSEAVEVDEALADVPQGIDDLLFTPDPGTRVRVINVNEASISLDFTASGIAVASDLAFGESSDFQRIDSAQFPITISQAGSATPLLERDLRLANSGDTTIIVYGSTDNLTLLAISEQDFDHRSLRTNIRFINASGEETVPMGLIVTEPSEAPDEASTADPVSTDEAATGRVSIPVGSNFLVDSQSPLTASAQIPLPLNAADFIIADNRSNLVGARLRNVALEQNRDYDIVAIYLPRTDSIRAVFIPYPEQ
jgi:hypothetical protein